MALVFCKQRFDFVHKTTIKKVKRTFQKPEHGKKYVLKMRCEEKNTVNKSKENGPEKLKQAAYNRLCS